MDTINLNVSGMSCGGCEKSIRNALLARDGVSEVTASHQAGTVQVEFDGSKISRAELAAAIEGAGFDVAA